MTTLELAEAIADAVAIAILSGQSGAQAVMAALREHGCWFCRLGTGATGETTQHLLPLE